jgi:hypothetical protein
MGHCLFAVRKTILCWSAGFTLVLVGQVCKLMENWINIIVRVVKGTQFASSPLMPSNKHKAPAQNF